MPPLRPGAFAANFTPDTLTRFRDLCKQHGRQYTKVLERLADLYLATNGEVLNSSFVPSPHQSSGSFTAPIDPAAFHQLLKRVELLESDYRIADEHLEGLLESLDERVGLLEK